MKRRAIVQFVAFFFARKAVAEQAPDIRKLEEDYFKAANALSRYRESHGFEPGVRVRCQFQNEPPKTGEICPYGESWAACSSYCVPILLDAGYRQPWPMSDLTLLTAE